MAIRRFAFEPGGKVRLEIFWKLGFRDIRIRLDGEEILSVPFATGLGSGVAFTFGDGAVLRVKIKNAFWPDIVASLDGRPLENVPE